MRFIRMIVLVCFSIIVCSGIIQAEEEKKAVPNIEVENPKYDVGQVSQGAMIKHDFRVFNRGSAPLEIRTVKPGWGCSVARFDRIIPPGGEGKIVLQVNTKGLQGNMNKTARVISNDPKKPNVTIGMIGKVWVPIHLQPTYARLTGVLGDTIKTVVHIRGEKEDPLIMKLASVSIPDKVAVDLDELEKGRRYNLKIMNKIERVTSYRGQVTLTTNYPEKPELVVRITGYIRPPVEVRPPVLRFLSLSEDRLKLFKKEGRVIKRPLIVFFNKRNGFKIDKVELEKELFKIHIDDRDAGRIQKNRVVHLMVEPILERLKKGHNTDRLKIFTNQKGHEILEVPIYFDIL